MTTAPGRPAAPPGPRRREHDHAEEQAARRRAFVRERTGAELRHVRGGTGPATRRECLEVLGRRGPGKALELAEICAAVVLAGDCVTSHEQYGRNRA